MIGADAGYVGEAQELRRLDADDAVEHAVLLVDQNRIAKAQTADRGCDLPKMSRLDFAHIARRDDEVSRRTLDKLELRHKIVANGMWRRRGCGERRELFAPVPAFRLQSIVQRFIWKGYLAMIAQCLYTVYLSPSTKPDFALFSGSQYPIPRS